MSGQTGLIAFTQASSTALELKYVADAIVTGLLSGDGPYTVKASELLSPMVGGGSCLLTTSCTHALEMAGLLLELQPGDEVILPSFTFVSSATAFVLRGAVPVFVDIRPDTLNIDEQLLEEAITERTKAIVVVHYGGVACEMRTISAIAEKHGIPVIEDNAHGLGAAYHGQPLGSFGVMATQSFHVTKNVSCGEGGALVLNSEELVHRAEILREKGTNRSQFFRGEVDKYRWVDIGSSYLPSDMLAAVLSAQLERFEDMQDRRQLLWSRYDEHLATWCKEYDAVQPTVPEGCSHPAHVYYLLLPSAEDRTRFIREMREVGIIAPSHYVPLHSSPYGSEVGRTGPSGCEVTQDLADRIVRLPLFVDLTDAQQAKVIDEVRRFRPQA